jgi:hypothetical protein
VRQVARCDLVKPFLYRSYTAVDRNAKEVCKYRPGLIGPADVIGGSKSAIYDEKDSA